MHESIERMLTEIAGQGTLFTTSRKDLTLQCQAIVKKLDLDRISRIRQLVSVPLVLHGTSGVPDDTVRECIARGMCKVNYATDLRIAFTRGVREYLEKDPNVYDPKKYSALGREYVKQYVMQKMEVCGSVGRA